MGSCFSDCWIEQFPDNAWCPSVPSKTAELEMEHFLRRNNMQVRFHIEAKGGGDAFSIRFDENGLHIEGGETGVLYGVFRCIAIMRAGLPDMGFSLSDTPVFTHRIINHWDNLDGSVERGYAGKSLFFSDNRIEYSASRIRHYARLLASVGINAVSINNVNVHPAAVTLITEDKLSELTGLAEIFRSYGIRLILSVNYASPVVLGELDTANPFDPKVRLWWKKQMDLIYLYIPDLFGIVVKADSEGQPGPFTYGANHADGANLLAEAIAPHGGLVFWRCFVYNHKQDWRNTEIDRPKAAFDTYKPLDGRFCDNVVLQIKFGPFDFQVREPVSPLLGAMPNTRQALEFQLAQEYTGHQIDLYYMAGQWREVLGFESVAGAAGSQINSIAAVSNIGNDANWTGNALAGANLYAYGRMAWNPCLDPGDIAGEWCGLMFAESARNVVKDMLLSSRNIYESYTTPMGLCWMVKPHTHYGPDPLGYEYTPWGTYHRADREAIGIDRSTRGTGFTAQYSETAAALYDSMDTCPEELLLFFHRVRYDHVLRNGKTLAQNMYDSHFKGAQEAEKLLETWYTLSGLIPCEIFENVLERLKRQVTNAKEWRDVFNTFLHRLSGIHDEGGRMIHI